MRRAYLIIFLIVFNIAAFSSICFFENVKAVDYDIIEDDTEEPTGFTTSTTEVTTEATTGKASVETTTETTGSTEGKTETTKIEAGSKTEEKTTETQATKPVPESISIENTDISVMKTETFQVIAGVKYSDGSVDSKASLKYKIGDSKIAKVDKTGLITGKKVGNTVLTIETKDGKISTSVGVTVTKLVIHVGGIKLDRQKASAKVGEIIKLNATVYPDDATDKKIIYTSSNKEIAKVDSKGIVTVKSVGEARITAKTRDGGYKAVCAITNKQTYFVVTSFGAIPNDKKSDSGAIRKALNLAKTTNKTLTIYVPKGTYYLTGMLPIYSNTKLILHPKAKLVRHKSFAGTMLQSLSKGRMVKGYGQCKNITIQGGTWDGGSNKKRAGDIMYIGHASGVTIKNTTIKNCYGVHMIELAGVKNAVISGVTCNGFKVLSKKAYPNTQTIKEAIQLDVCSKNSTPAMKPWDKTHCKNIVIKNCNIKNYMCGIGTHSLFKNAVAKNITIKNNSFYNITNTCIDLRNFKNVKIRGNAAVGFNNFLYTTKSSGSVVGNFISNKKFKHLIKDGLFTANGISLTNKSSFKISDNTIERCKGSAIVLVGGSKSKLLDNVIADNKKYAVRSEKSNLTMTGNIIAGNVSGAYDIDDHTVLTSDDITAYKVKLEDSYPFSGEPVIPDISLHGLVKNQDYDIMYKNNLAPGTATATIRGKGRVKGELVVEYTIE